MDIKESSIFFDEKNEMYKIDLWFYTRFFDYIIYANNWILREFWKENIVVDDFRIDWNFVFWFTKSFWKILFNIFNLDNFESIYRVVDNVNLFSFCIKWKNYFLLVFLDLENNIWYYTNFKDANFEIIIQDNLVYVKNNIFNSIVFKKELNFTKKEVYKFDKPLENSILDFHFWANLFSKDDFDITFKDFEKLFSNSNIILENKYWVKSFLLKTNNLKDFLEFKKLVLTFNKEQFLCYSIDNKEIKELFNEIEDISNFKLEELNFDFKIPENTFEYDESFLKFQKNIFKLQYILFSLKLSYEKILNQKEKDINEYTNLAFNRLSLTKENLEKNIIFYEEMYSKLKALIMTFKKNKYFK